METTIPTYVFPVIAALTQAGVQGGLKRDLALRLAAGVVRGSGALLLETGCFGRPFPACGGCPGAQELVQCP